jgi:TPR repeat protein
MTGREASVMALCLGLIATAPSPGFAQDTPEATGPAEGAAPGEVPVGLLMRAGGGDPLAQQDVAYLYEQGQGVLQDFAEAARWYRLSAEQGEAFAQRALGALYQDGRGVAQDNILAHMWFNIASAAGDREAEGARERLARRMTAEEVNEAHRLARLCLESGFAECDRPVAPEVTGTGAPMTEAERHAFRVAIQACWFVEPGSEAARVVVRVAFELDRSGRVVGGVRLIGASAGSDAAVSSAFEAARRAILRCQADGYRLPPEKYDQWRQIEMSFDPDQSRQQ